MNFEWNEFYVYLLSMDLNLFLQASIGFKSIFYACLVAPERHIPHHQSVNLDQIMQLYFYLLFVFFQENDFDLYFHNRVRRFTFRHKRMNYPFKVAEPMKCIFDFYYDYFMWMAFVNKKYKVFCEVAFYDYLMLDKIHNFFKKIIHLIVVLADFYYTVFWKIYVCYLILFLLHRKYYLSLLEKEFYSRYVVFLLYWWNRWFPYLESIELFLFLTGKNSMKFRFLFKKYKNLFIWFSAIYMFKRNWKKRWEFIYYYIMKFVLKIIKPFYIMEFKEIIETLYDNMDFKVLAYVEDKLKNIFIDSTSEERILESYGFTKKQVIDDDWDDEFIFAPSFTYTRVIIANGFHNVFLRVNAQFYEINWKKKVENFKIFIFLRKNFYNMFYLYKFFFKYYVFTFFFNLYIIFYLFYLLDWIRFFYFRVFLLKLFCIRCLFLIFNYLKVRFFFYWPGNWYISNETKKLIRWKVIKNTFFLKKYYLYFFRGFFYYIIILLFNRFLLVLFLLFLCTNLLFYLNIGVYFFNLFFSGIFFFLKTFFFYINLNIYNMLLESNFKVMYYTFIHNLFWWFDIYMFKNAYFLDYAYWSMSMNIRRSVEIFECVIERPWVILKIRFGYYSWRRMRSKYKWYLPFFIINKYVTPSFKFNLKTLWIFSLYKVYIFIKWFFFYGFYYMIFFFNKYIPIFMGIYYYLYHLYKFIFYSFMFFIFKLILYLLYIYKFLKYYDIFFYFNLYNLFFYFLNTKLFFNLKYAFIICNINFSEFYESMKMDFFYYIFLINKKLIIFLNNFSAQFEPNPNRLNPYIFTIEHRAKFVRWKKARYYQFRFLMLQGKFLNFRFRRLYYKRRILNYLYLFNNNYWYVLDKMEAQSIFNKFVITFCYFYWSYIFFFALLTYMSTRISKFLKDKKQALLDLRYLWQHWNINQLDQAKPAELNVYDELSDYYFYGLNNDKIKTIVSRTPIIELKDIDWRKHEDIGKEVPEIDVEFASNSSLRNEMQNFRDEKFIMEYRYFWMYLKTKYMRYIGEIDNLFVDYIRGKKHRYNFMYNFDFWLPMKYYKNYENLEWINKVYFEDKNSTRASRWFYKIGINYMKNKHGYSFISEMSDKEFEKRYLFIYNIFKVKEKTPFVNLIDDEFFNKLLKYGSYSYEKMGMLGKVSDSYLGMPWTDDDDESEKEFLITDYLDILSIKWEKYVIGDNVKNALFRPIDYLKWLTYIDIKYFDNISNTYLYTYWLNLISSNKYEDYVFPYKPSLLKKDIVKNIKKFYNNIGVNQMSYTDVMLDSINKGDFDVMLNQRRDMPFMHIWFVLSFFYFMCVYMFYIKYMFSFYVRRIRKTKLVKPYVMFRLIVLWLFILIRMFNIKLYMLFWHNDILRLYWFFTRRYKWEIDEKYAWFEFRHGWLYFKKLRRWRKYLFNKEQTLTFLWRGNISLLEFNYFRLFLNASFFDVSRYFYACFFFNILYFSITLDFLLVLYLVIISFWFEFFFRYYGLFSKR